MICASEGEKAGEEVRYDICEGEGERKLGRWNTPHALVPLSLLVH